MKFCPWGVGEFDANKSVLSKLHTLRYGTYAVKRNRFVDKRVDSFIQDNVLSGTHIENEIATPSCRVTSGFQTEATPAVALVSSNTTQRPLSQDAL